MDTKLVRGLLVLAVVGIATLPAFSQADVSSATLKGTVTDPTGALLPGATVTAKNVETGIRRETITDALGAYLIRPLPPGLYELRTTLQGFATNVLSEITLTVGQIAIYDVQLSLGAVTLEIVVSGAAPLVETERPQQANTITEQQIENLPNLGRGLTAYVFALPGVSNSEAPRSQQPYFTFGTSGFSIGGSNGRNNLVTVDGGENEYGSGQLRYALSPESIQEFQVNRNAFAAEFGFTAGTAVNVISRGGTNNFHGSVYTFYRSQKTSAANFFDHLTPQKAFDQRVYPGFTFGGPLVKNKAFIFTSYEWTKQDAARFRSYTDNPGILGPTVTQNSYLDQLAGSNDPTLIMTAAALRGALTTTNYPTTLKLLGDNEGTFNSPTRIHNWTTRADWQISNNDSLSGRFTLFRSDADGIVETNTIAPSNANTVFSRDYTAVATWTHNVGANVVNQLRTQFVPNNSSLALPKDPAGTQISISGVGTFGRYRFNPFNTFQDRYQFEDTLSWSKGRHSFKFGGSYRPVNYKVINELWFGAEWSFSPGIYPLILLVPAGNQAAFAAFNLSMGLPANGPPAANLSGLQSFNVGLPFLYRQGFGNQEWTDWAHYFALFVQDSWKVTPGFTLDYGLRFDYDNEAAPLNAKGYVSPRLGFAWDPFGDKKTVIRGGGGVFVSPIYYQVAYVTSLLDDSGRYINQVFRTPASLPATQTPAALWGAGLRLGKLPFTALSPADVTALGVPTGPGSPGRVIFEASPDYENNYSIQASLGISRELVRDLSLDIAYQMYRGVHLQMPVDVNYRETGVVHPLFGPQLTAIDPTVTQRNLYSSIGNSIYHGMTASLNKHFSSNYSFLANYTFSKAIDDVTDFNSSFHPYVPTRRFLERALSTFDIRHIFVASGVFRTPFKAGAGANALGRAFADIAITPIVRLQTGIPFTVTMGTDVNGDFHPEQDRPFAASRNTGMGDNFYSADLRVSKQFYFNRDSGVRLEFIAEAANLFNRANFLSVQNVVGTTSPLLNGPFNVKGIKGIPRTTPLAFNAAAPGRQIQFGLKIAF